MDKVPSDFRERVAVLWKCCESGYTIHLAGCVKQHVPDCEWTRQLKRQRTTFTIGYDNGEWKHIFSNPDDTKEASKPPLTMDELLKHPNLKKISVRRIEVTNISGFSVHSLQPLTRDINRLMKFVAFLSNEPQLVLFTSNVEDFDSIEGKTLLNCIYMMTFSYIYASKDFPVYNQLLENQFSRRNPTLININELADNRAFFIEHLKNGNIKRFNCLGDFCFPIEAMKGIIDSFVENPENYSEKQFSISASFEESTKDFLEEKLKDGRCVEEDFQSYRFKVFNPKMKKEQSIIVRSRRCYSVFMKMH